MHEIELVIGLLIVIGVLVTVAERIGVAYPIVLVLGGLVLGFVPGLPHVELAPEIVFVLFLPPILFSTAYDTSWRDFTANLRPISLLAIGLVMVTVGAVAITAHAVVDGLSWAEALVLGAIVSPPDAVATRAIVQRLGVPRRIVTVLEGESLINDATALVALRFATAAVVTGAFSAWAAAGQFVLVAIGGVLIGLVVGWALTEILARLDNLPIEVLATLIAPIAAYLPAEELGVSGVLATVTAGLMLGRRAPELMPAASRLQGRAVWDLTVFIVNGLVFILIGLQLPSVVEALSERPAGEVIGAAVAVSAVAILVRIAWVFPATYVPRWIVPGLAKRDPAPPWQLPAVLAWAGPRGVVSLAAALALPLETDAGDPFPERALILFLTFAVILATLVGQGLTLPPLIRLLGVSADDEAEREETLARREATLGALARLEELAGEDWVPAEDVPTLRKRYENRLSHLPESLDAADRDDEHLDAHHRLRQEILQAERAAIIDLRNRGEIGDDAMRRVENDLDLAELRSGT